MTAVVGTEIQTHALEDGLDKGGVRRLLGALREPGVHLLLIDGGVRLPMDLTALASSVRDAPVATFARGHVEGSNLALFSAGRYRCATGGTTFAWGSSAAVPGLAAILESASPTAATRLMWGEVLDAAEAVGDFVHRVDPDLKTALSAIGTNMAQAGGGTALALRLRSVTAARESGSWQAAAAFDRHLAEVENRA